MLNLIGGLYKLGRKLKKASAGERHSMRQQLAVPVLNDIFTWCREYREKFLPKEPINSVIQYALNQEVGHVSLTENLDYMSFQDKYQFDNSGTIGQLEVDGACTGYPACFFMNRSTGKIDSVYLDRVAKFQNGMEGDSGFASDSPNIREVCVDDRSSLYDTVYASGIDSVVLQNGGYCRNEQDAKILRVEIGSEGKLTDEGFVQSVVLDKGGTLDNGQGSIDMLYYYGGTIKAEGNIAHFIDMRGADAGMDEGYIDEGYLDEDFSDNADWRGGECMVVVAFSG